MTNQPITDWKDPRSMAFLAQVVKDCDGDWRRVLLFLDACAKGAIRIYIR